MDSLRLAKAASGTVWALIFVVVVFATSALVTPWLAPSLPGMLLKSAIPLFVAAVLVSFVLPRPSGVGRWSGIALGPGRRHTRYALVGLAAGVGAAGGVVGLLYFAGAVHIARGPIEADWATGSAGGTLALSVVIFIVASAGEELLFRGYGFQQLSRALRPEGAAAAAAILFGLMHSRNPAASGVSILNTALFGLLFGLALARHRSLWLPYGAHVGWNFTLAILGAEISGLKIKVLGLTTQASGAEWLSGGAYGPEASVLTSGAVGLLLWLTATTPVIEDDKTLIWDDIDEIEPGLEGG